MASSSSSCTAFTSPLGPIHHAHPSQQGASLRTLFSLLRRNGSSSSSTKSSSASKPSSSPLSLDCTLDTREKSTYTPSSATNAFSSPPPPYSFAPTGLEEDLVVLQEEEELIEESPAEKKQRLKAEKLEKKRREVLEADRRMDEALKSWGL
jgi:hypothetical protein